MTWCNVVYYNIFFHETENIIIYLHVGSNRFDSTRLVLEYEEKVKLSFDDSAKAHLFITQLERALSNNVTPRYNKENGWISIKTSRYSSKST